MVSAAPSWPSTAAPISSLKYGKCHWSGASTTPSSAMNRPAVIFLMVSSQPLSVRCLDGLTIGDGITHRGTFVAQTGGRERESPHQGVADAVALLCRMSSWQLRCDCPVCSMHTRTGDSVSDGYTSSFGPAVAVGLETSPGCSDQIVAFVVGRGAQYAGAPRSVVPPAPHVAQVAPTTTPRNLTPPRDAAAG